MIWLLACTGDPEPTPHSHHGTHSGLDSHAMETPDECLETEAREDVAALDEDLDSALTSDSRWDGWRVSASHVALAAQVDDGWCLGNWHDGSVHWTLTADEPVFLTPLFGYWFGSAEVNRTEWEALFTAATQPTGVADALTALHADRAVILPLDANGMDRDTAYYLGLHEAFHVHVQSPVWQGRPLVAWSTWDVPTDRSGIASACYDGVGAERSALDEAVAAALAGGDVCTPAGDFLSRRASRYEALDGVLVGEHTCAEAEAIMEVVEGVPEWWYLQLALDAEKLDVEAVEGKLGATSGDVFYKTGAGQMFLLQALGVDVPSALEASTSWEDGSLTAQLAAACSG